MTAPNSVLIIGASGRTGINIIQQLSEQPVHPDIYAYCRNPSKLDTEVADMCKDVLQGDARNAKDLERALSVSGADMVIVCVGNGDSVKKSDTRTANAKALVQVLQKPAFRNVRALVMSSSGAGTSVIKAGFGLGMLIEYHLKYVLQDHTGQEEVFLKYMKDRTMIVRPTALNENQKTGDKVVAFGDKEKCPTLNTSREDLAAWLVQEAICREDSVHFGAKPLNLTCVKQ